MVILTWTNWNWWLSVMSVGVTREQLSIPANTKHLYNIYTTSVQHCINVIQVFCDCWYIINKLRKNGIFRCECIHYVNMAFDNNVMMVTMVTLWTWKRCLFKAVVHYAPPTADLVTAIVRISATRWITITKCVLVQLLQHWNIIV